MPQFSRTFQKRSHVIYALLFEKFWTLIAALGAIQLVLIMVWSNRRTNRSRRVMLIGLGACIALGLLSRMVVTDREQVMQTCRTLIELTERGDVDGIARFIHHDFDADGIDRSQFVDAVKRTLFQIQVQDPWMRNFRAQVDKDQVEARFSVTCKLISESQIDYGVISAWTVRFERDGDQWKLISVQPRETPAFPFSRLSQIIR